MTKTNKRWEFGGYGRPDSTISIDTGLCNAEIFLVGRDIWKVFEQRTKLAQGQYLGRESGYTKV